MQEFTVTKGATSVILPISIYDSSSVIGAKLAGLVFNSASLTAYYNRTGAAGAATVITLVTATKGTWVSSGFIAVDGTNMPGDYELHVPDAVIATGVDTVLLQLKGAADMVPINIKILLTALDLQTAASTVDENAAATLNIQTSVGGAAGSWGKATTDTLADTNELQSDDVPGLIATAQADLDIITDSDGVILGAAGVDKILDEVNTGAAHNVNNSLGQQIRETRNVLVITSDDCPASGSHTTSNVILATGEPTGNVAFVHDRLSITEGTNAGLNAIITGYNGTTKTVTITPAFPVPCDDTSLYEIGPGIVHAQTNEGGYDNGFVYISPSGSTTAQVGVDGTIAVPIDDGSFANALAIAVEKKLSKFDVAPGASITLAASLDNKIMDGALYTLALGGQSISNTLIQNCRNITGIATGAAQPAFVQCGMGNVTLPPSNGFVVGFSGTFTLGSVGIYSYGECQGFNITGNPVFDFNSLGGATLLLVKWGNGIQLNNMAAGDVLNITGDGDIVIDATCSNATVNIEGIYTVTNSGTNMTINQEARLDLTAIQNTVWDAILTGALHNVPTSAGSRLRMISEVVQVDSAVDDPGAAATTSTFNTDLTEVDDFWNDALIVFTSGALSGQARPILDFAQTNGVITVSEVLTSVPADNVTFTIVSDHIHPVTQIAEGVLATQLTESYAADGVAPTLTQAVMLIQQKVGDFAIVGTTLTVFELDGTTVAATYTLNSDTAPTTTTRTT